MVFDEQRKRKEWFSPSKDWKLSQSVHGVNIALVVWALLATMYCFLLMRSSCPYVAWHGGSPLDTFGGSCYCGKDQYCMCTPSLAIDAIIEITNDANKVHSLVLVNRGVTPTGYALTGGFVDVGETVETATIREVKEETNLDVDSLEQFRVYSDPKRDKRRHTVSSVFICRTKDKSEKNLRRGDDAKSVVMIPLEKVLSLRLAFDHKEILLDYFKKYHPEIYANAQSQQQS